MLYNYQSFCFSIALWCQKYCISIYRVWIQSERVSGLSKMFWMKHKICKFPSDTDIIDVIFIVWRPYLKQDYSQPHLSIPWLWPAWRPMGHAMSFLTHMLNVEEITLTCWVLLWQLSLPFICTLKFFGIVGPIEVSCLLSNPFPITSTENRVAYHFQSFSIYFIQLHWRTLRT